MRALHAACMQSIHFVKFPAAQFSRTNEWSAIWCRPYLWNTSFLYKWSKQTSPLTHSKRNKMRRLDKLNLARFKVSLLPIILDYMFCVRTGVRVSNYFFGDSIRLPANRLAVEYTAINRLSTEMNRTCAAKLNLTKPLFVAYEENEAVSWVLWTILFVLRTIKLFLTQSRSWHQQNCFTIPCCHFLRKLQTEAS